MYGVKFSPIGIAQRYRQVRPPARGASGYVFGGRPEYLKWISEAAGKDGALHQVMPSSRIAC